MVDILDHRLFVLTGSAFMGIGTLLIMLNCTLKYETFIGDDISESIQSRQGIRFTILLTISPILAVRQSIVATGTEWGCTVVSSVRKLLFVDIEIHPFNGISQYISKPLLVG